MDETDLNRWRTAAAHKLDDQRARAARYQTYYDGEETLHVLFGGEERRIFGKFLDESRANWCELVANAAAERLTVTGFRFDGEGGDDAWDIWQASHMDADHKLAQLDALVTGSSCVLVQPDDDNPTGVSISVESPLEACVLHEPGNRRRRAAGYKRFGDLPGEGNAVTEVLILPDVIATWYPNATRPEQAPNPAGEVGMIEIIPQPRTVGPPRSELHSCISIQDRINLTVFNRLVTGDYTAFQRVWATGIKVAREIVKSADGTETTKGVRPFDLGVNRLLVNENPEGRFGIFPEATLEGYLKSVDQDVNQLAAITQTPSYYFHELVNLSADAITASEAGLVAKCKLRALYLGEDWEEVVRLALRLTGNPAGADVGAEVIWADVEIRSLAQLVDALVKLGSPPLNVPRRVLWERYGATLQEVERWETLAATEQANAAATAATAFGAPDGAYARLLAAAGAGANGSS
jgi:hypothetical protein